MTAGRTQKQELPENLLRHSLLEAADDEFGTSPSYWYTLLCISMHNQKVAEEIIDRCICAAKRSVRKTGMKK